MKTAIIFSVLLAAGLLTTSTADMVMAHKSNNRSSTSTPDTISSISPSPSSSSSSDSTPSSSTSSSSPSSSLSSPPQPTTLAPSSPSSSSSPSPTIIISPTTPGSSPSKLKVCIKQVIPGFDCFGNKLKTTTASSGHTPEYVAGYGLGALDGKNGIYDVLEK